MARACSGAAPGPVENKRKSRVLALANFDANYCTAIF